MAAECLKNRKGGRQGSCIPLGKTLHFGRIQRREFSVLNRLPVLSRALLCSDDISHHLLDPENLREEATMADLTKDLAWEF